MTDKASESPADDDTDDDVRWYSHFRAWIQKWHGYEPMDPDARSKFKKAFRAGWRAATREASK